MKDTKSKEYHENVILTSVLLKEHNKLENELNQRMLEIDNLNNEIKTIKKDMRAIDSLFKKLKLVEKIM
jgi:ABC-type phosphate transport system auxiliary subunit